MRDPYLELADYRRRVASLYRGVREGEGDAATRLARFRREKDILFGEHPQSPVPVGSRATFGGLAYWPYQAELRVVGRDATNDSETYGGGRYVWDSAKGADLGPDDDGLVLDFNYAYHPSCVYDSRWSCPLAPPANWLGVPVRAGERLVTVR